MRKNYFIYAALPFERYVSRGVNYPRNVPSQLPLERRKEGKSFYLRSASVRTLRLAGCLLPTQYTFTTSVST